MFKGSFPAVVTPFKNDKIDKEAFQNIIQMLVDQGVDGIVCAGSTGEAATLSDEEKCDLVTFTRDVVDDDMPIILGTGTNNTKTSITLTKKAKDVGADGVLMVSPYYNKPTQEGLYQHYKAIAEAVDIPIILYTVPGRTSSHIMPETVARLAEIDNIVAVKEASGNLDNVTKILTLSPDFTVLSGDDSLTFPMLCLGGSGVISTTANIAPKDFYEMCHSYFDGDLLNAQKMHYKTFPLIKAMFIETNPIPVKAAMKHLGWLNGDIRLPLTPMSENNFERMKKILEAYEGLPRNK
jgi:4-hydroxy-tetrahydrodipicolinate synthase